MIKLFKLFLFCCLQFPITVFYYLDPTNPWSFIAFQYLMTIFMFLQDNAISYCIDAVQAIHYNFEELLKKICKVIPKNPKDSDFDDKETD